MLRSLFEQIREALELDRGEAGGGSILKPLIVAQIPHLTPQSTPHPSVIPAQAGIYFQTCDQYAPKTDHPKSQWFPACAGMTIGRLSQKVHAALIEGYTEVVDAHLFALRSANGAFSSQPGATPQVNVRETK